VLPTDELQKRCPTISSLDQAFVQGAATGQFAGYADRLLRLYATGPAGIRQVNSLIRAADSNLYAVWREQPQDLRLGLLHVVNETRQAYAHTELQRTIPWRSSSKANSPTAPANQTCTWTMCAPKALVAINVCNVYGGVNSSLGGAFGARNGNAGPLVWGLFTEAIMHMQVGRGEGGLGSWVEALASWAIWPADWAGCGAGWPACCWPHTPLQLLELYPFGTCTWGGAAACHPPGYHPQTPACAHQLARFVVHII
jgi:hypothetical protein